MDIQGKKIMILGGWGLVGTAILRRLSLHKPKEVVLLSLKESEAKTACENMQKETSGIDFIPEWGNIFVNHRLKDLPRAEMFSNPEYRTLHLKEVMETLDEKMLTSSWLYQLISKHKPDILIDAVNSATSLAYQDVFTGYYNLQRELIKASRQQELTDSLLVEIDKILATQYIPQIIRHVQILHAAMVENNTGFYLKIGTTGTGGMGLNIPYTHSEERPSRVLMSKSALAGAHTMLLFLMSRTPGGPLCKEIKPAAVIAWKGIKYGEIHKRGKSIKLYDCQPDQAQRLVDTYDFDSQGSWRDLADTLKSVYIDTGENGLFSLGEFETITSYGQMEFVTPEEIASSVIMEILGDSSGHDVINALENSVMGPTYRAGYLRHQAITRMAKLEEQYGSDSIAFEILGPPRLSKLLYEGALLKRCFGSLEALKNRTAEEISEQAEIFITKNSRFRSEAISIGIPILRSNGIDLLRGPNVVIPIKIEGHELPVTAENIDKWARAGWIDLRTKNMTLWKSRAEKIIAYVKGIPAEDSSSHYSHGISYWSIDEPMNVSKVVAWIFIHEDKGLRIKR